MLVIGIDPGKTGAIALYDTRRKEPLSVWPIPITVRPYTVVKRTSLLDRKKAEAAGKKVEKTRVSKRVEKKYDLKEMLVIFRFLEMFKPTVSIVEKVQGWSMQAGASEFDFGIGAVHAFSTMIGCEIREVTPSDWKLGMKLNVDKTLSINLADKLWPKHKWLWRDADGKERHDFAEAVLLTHYEVGEWSKK